MMPKKERSEKQKAQFLAAQQLAYKKRRDAAEAKKPPLEESPEPVEPEPPAPKEPEPEPEPKPEPEPEPEQSVPDRKVRKSCSACEKLFEVDMPEGVDVARTSCPHCGSVETIHFE